MLLFVTKFMIPPVLKSYPHKIVCKLSLYFFLITDLRTIIDRSLEIICFQPQRLHSVPNSTQQASNKDSGLYLSILEISLSNVIYFGLLLSFWMSPYKATLGLAFPSLENNPTIWFIEKKSDLYPVISST